MVHYAGRRRFLQLVGVGVALGAAGCTGTANSDGSGDEGGAGTDAGRSTAAGTGSAGGTTEETGTGTGTGADGGSSHGSHSGHDGVPSGPSGSATVKMRSKDGGFHFEPHVVWVEAGGTVTWELVDGSHTATAYAEANDKPTRIPEGAEAFDSGTLSEQGATFEHTFETEGVYDYFCLPHETMGMIGSVVVGRPDASGPGLQPPQESLPGEAPKKIESLNETVTAALEGSGSGESTGEGTADGHGSGGGHGDEAGTGTGHAEGGHGSGTETDHHG